MAILSGPATPTDAVVRAMMRSQRADPFGQLAEMRVDPRLAAIQSIVKLIERLCDMLKSMSRSYREPDRDDFMKGWGEPGGDLD